ncbi:MAG: 30S ribosomal protein S16 [Dehalococcoidales bacterium]|nr:30S ribosomal protein S16 [Dehalococcoidales bacterium]
MLKIRLRRVGGKKQPSYRLVVADSRTPRGGAFVSIIGHYNPLTNPETVVIDAEQAKHWLSKGAQPTVTAARLLAKVGLVEAKARIVKTSKPVESEKHAETNKPEDKEKA